MRSVDRGSSACEGVITSGGCQSAAGAARGASLGPDEIWETGSVIHEPQRVTDRPAHTTVSFLSASCVRVWSISFAAGRAQRSSVGV